MTSQSSATSARRRLSLRPARPPLLGVALAVATLAVATLLAAGARQFGVTNAAIVYLLAVVAVGTIYGSWLAIGTSIAAFLIYDFEFVEPVHTFAIAAPEEWLDLLLFLVVAIAIGRLSALQSERRREAELRTSEARTIYALSRDIATVPTALEAAPLLVTRLAREAEMARVWIGLGPAIGDERVVADTKPGEQRPPLSHRWLLHASSPDAPPTWARIADPGAPAAHAAPAATAAHLQVFRAPILAGGETIGSVWATRVPNDPFPGRSHSRLLAAAADQIGQAVVRDRLAAEATAAEVAREGDALKSALLDSVSHDLRTPLAGIRAAAGNLMDADVSSSAAEVRSAARSIDREAERLSRLVQNMLDLGRIQGDALHPSLELYDLADLVAPAVERMAPLLAPARVQVSMPPDLPPVRADAVFIDQILTNLLENCARYAPGKPIRLTGRVADDEVELVVEDGGPGVPRASVAHLFDRFYQGPSRPGSRTAVRTPAAAARSPGSGAGLGLAVVRGLAEAMGGSVSAGPSELGGLAVTVRLQCESVEAAG